MAEQNKVLERRNAQLDQDLTRERISRSKLHNVLEDMKGKIRVIARVRPLSTKETTVDGETASSVVKDGKASVSVLQNNGKGGVDTKKFTFDSVFQGVTRENSQDAFFEDVRALVTSAIDGDGRRYNVCLFAYGQTGSGKTYTMGSDCRIGESFDEAAKVKIEAGIAPRAAAAVFELLEKLDSQAASAVTLTMFEIYCDKVVDLLANKSNLELHQKADNLKITLAEHSDNGLVQVQGSTEVRVESCAELVSTMATGIAARARTVHATKMNSESSRSHLVGPVLRHGWMRGLNTLDLSWLTRRTGSEQVGKLTLVDLAGSERVDKSGAQGERLKEATAINKSLSALGDVISALTHRAASPSGASHVPYRNHPLTMLMSDSLGGSAKTMMIVCASPAQVNAPESVSSLKFATRCKDVRSLDPKAAQAQIAELRTELAKVRKSALHAATMSASAPPGTPNSAERKGPIGLSLKKR
ncbi:P-loop containing nucleoside triphosphate hydrolase protein [Pelagophyceae sp. CCMP2097]|nr:P-loop containing nucleoside triphosphate hydrolase protein [Pelagophyceae sp. CCMP2097]